MKVQIEITDDAADSIRRFTDVRVEAALRDEFNARTIEEVRSYAVEALGRILVANPHAFDFVARMADVQARKRGEW